MGVRARKRQRKLPAKLRAIRDALGLNQSELLQEFGIKDLRQSNISDYERGRIEPPLYLLLKYSEYANVCLEVLVDDKHDLPRQIPAKTYFHKH